MTIADLAQMREMAAALPDDATRRVIVMLLDEIDRIERVAVAIEKENSHLRDVLKQAADDGLRPMRFALEVQENGRFIVCVTAHSEPTERIAAHVAGAMFAATIAAADKEPPMDDVREYDPVAEAKK